MAARIALLPDSVIDQIAAGEVIERPASVLRELLDNALDAQSDRIVIDIEGGGIESIVVLDNGHGIAAEDATKALLRHATSKIRDLQDLQALRSRGFRGEALASISAVSRFSMTTRAADATSAVQVRSEGSQQPDVSPTAGQPGTRVEVRDLFYNVPARRKFLKSAPTETAHINKALMRAALSRPDVRFEIRRAGTRRKLYTPSDSLGRAKQVLGTDSLTDITTERASGIYVRAHLSSPQESRSGASNLHLMVNGRPVLDGALARSVAFAYGSVLPPGRFPVGVVFVDLDPSTVDINVHPQKLEVRFSDARLVHETLTRQLARALGTEPWSQVQQTSQTYAQSYPSSRSHSVSHGTANRAVREPTMQRTDAWASLSLLRDATSAYGSAPSPEHSERTTGPFASLTPIAQLRSLFILCEGEQGLYIIDQHAADERIRYAKLHTQFENQSIQTQRLLFPAQVEVGEQALAWLESHPESLRSLGIDADRISETEIVVRALPALVAKGDPATLVEQALGELQRDADRAWSDVLETTLATMACHAALRRGDRISLRECSALLAQLDATESFKEHCPHGRPVVFMISFADLEKKLGR